MMQLWLTVLGAVLMWRADTSARIRGLGPEAVALVAAGWGCVIAAVVLVFVNGGVTG